MESPWPAVVILMVGAVGCLVRWRSGGRGRFLGVAAVLLLLVPVMWAVERAVVTPREEIEAAVYGVTTAFQRKQPEETLSFVSPRAPDIRFLVQTAVAAVTIEGDLRVSDVRVEMLAENSRARSHFRANAAVSVIPWGDVGHQPTRWEVTWQKEGGRWQIIDVRQLDPVRDEEISQWRRLPSLRQ